VDARPLDGKVCLITGASSGLGRSTAERFASAGADVALVARSEAGLLNVAEEAGRHGGRVVVLPLDLADAGACRAAVHQAVAELGRLDVVVSAAATDVPGSVEELEVDGWDRVLDVNLRAPFLLAKHAFAHLREAGGGTIINVSSVAGRRGWAEAGAYCASKFGLTGLTQTLNAEGRPHGIRACVVYPGAMDTHWGAWGAEERDEERSAGGAGGADGSDPTRALPPEQVADLLVWIAAAPAGLVLNETTITPLHEQGWP
jgi:NAD(P)-dependent dehydrogenase (short-subunit alcohol dehydrogenase family)